MISKFSKLSKVLLVGAFSLAIASCATQVSQSADSKTDSSQTQSRSIIADVDLESNINDAINSIYPSSKFPHRSYAVVWYGKTLLLGQANSQELKDKIADVASKVYGVKEVINNIYPNPDFNPTVSETVSDSRITSEIRAKLLVAKGIQSTNFKIITQDGLVYILSTASASELSNAVKIVKAVRGVKGIFTVTP